MNQAMNPEGTTVPTEKEKAEGFDRLVKFFKELLDSVETIDGIADQYCMRTMSDVFYLQQAILKNGYIDHYEDESSLLRLLRNLPSAALWLSYVKEPECVAF